MAEAQERPTSLDDALRRRGVPPPAYPRWRCAVPRPLLKSGVLEIVQATRGTNAAAHAGLVRVFSARGVA